jgi:hypothetical protein
MSGEPTRHEDDLRVKGRLWPDQTFLFGEHRVFGATARALKNVLDVAFTAV